MIRQAGARDLALMLDWAAAEGWNPGLEDAEAFLAADPDGFFLALEDDRPAACISVVNHAPDFAFLGFYIAHPDVRGRGIGHALWRHALAHAGARTVGLDGVEAQEANYARSGFVRTGATLRHEGRLPEVAAPGIRPATLADAGAIAALDAAATGVARPRFLGAWTRDTATRKTVVMEDDRVSGVATARLCRDGCKLGPVIAGSEEGALALAFAAAAALGARDVVLDVPEAQAGLRSRLAAEGFTVGFATARMYRGTPPAGDGSLYGIATMELG